MNDTAKQINKPMVFSPKLKFRLFDKSVYAFHFFGVLGFLLGTIVCVMLTIELRLETGIILLLSALGVLIFFSLAYAAKWKTGNESIVYYHHEVAIIVLSAIVLFAFKMPVLPYLDIVVLGIGVFLALGRIGCLSAGCCHGKPCRNGIVYGKEHVHDGFTRFYENTPLFPVQAVESVCALIAVTAGILMLTGGSEPGTVLVFYTLFYGTTRYTIEFYRGDPERSYLFGLSEAQWTTVTLIGVTFLMGITGWLPEFSLHLIVLIVMIFASVIAIISYKNIPQHRLLSVFHVMELAEGLEMLEEADRLTEKTCVNIFKTTEGLNVSRGNFISGERRTYHYTFSHMNEPAINRQVIEKIVMQIKLMNRFNGGFSIMERNKGIYHILLEHV